MIIIFKVCAPGFTKSGDMCIQCRDGTFKRGNNNNTCIKCPLNMKPLYDKSDCGNQ